MGGRLCLLSKYKKNGRSLGSRIRIEWIVCSTPTPKDMQKLSTYSKYPAKKSTPCISKFCNSIATAPSLQASRQRTKTPSIG